MSQFITIPKWKVNREMEEDDQIATPDLGDRPSEEDDQEEQVDSATKVPEQSGDFDDRLLARERARDVDGNNVTRPPDGESITFWSVTIVEMYAGRAVDSLTKALSAMEWAKIDTPITDEIVEAQRGYVYSRSKFWFMADPMHLACPMRHAQTTLPPGMDRIHGEYYVLGPSLVALVLTFVLDDEERHRIDVALRDDAESRLDRLGQSKVSVKSVRNVKSERLRAIREDIATRCRSWIRDTMPGTLSEVREGLGPPTCALISLAQGTPFNTHVEYMALLDLVNEWLAERFVSPDFLYLVYPIDIAPNNRMTGVFNGGEALSQGWIHDFSVQATAPEVFHEAISSLVIADGIYAVLMSYEPRLRDVRSGLNRLDFDKATGQEVFALRNRLLEISRDVSTVCGDVTVLLNDPFAIWADMPQLVRLKSNPASSATDDTVAAKRRQLRSTVADLLSQEANLRELILVTSASASEATGIELQTKVLALTNKLGTFTIVLIVLTFVLVALGAIALFVQLVHNPVVQVPFPPLRPFFPRFAGH